MYSIVRKIDLKRRSGGSNESARSKGSGNKAQFVTCFNCGMKGDYRSDCTKGKKVGAKEEPKRTFRFPSVSIENISSAMADQHR